jgi:uncharacterized surface protein with fasciclin (FAS1) repeats
MVDSTAVAMDTTMVLKLKHCRCSSCKRRFSTLVTAVKAANLVETLSGDGPFTVFAPNNAAFAKLQRER